MAWIWWISMCGRNSLFLPALDLETRFDASIAPDVSYTPRYNIAPGSNLEVITNTRPGTIDEHHWGLIPPWADAVGDGLINARAETAAEKPAFREAWAKRPCLVLTSGFYEWESANGGPKQPYRIYKENETAFALAGLWEETRVDGELVRSVTILTTEPNDVVEPIHDRMPVVLPTTLEEAWLEVSPDGRAGICQPYREPDLVAYPIDFRVNDPSNDDARILEPAEHKQTDIDEFGHA